MNSIRSVLSDLIANRAEHLRVNVSLHSYLRKLTSVNHLDSLAEGESRPYQASRRDPVIAAVTFVKDEGNLPHLLAEHILDYCDYVIISDASRPQLKTDSRLSHPQIKLIDQDIPFNEARVYDQLFHTARKLGATHILHIDVDERISQKLSPTQLRSFATQMSIGDCLTVPWQQIWRQNKTNYEINFEKLFTSTQHPRHIPPYKDLLFCDDGQSIHRPFQLHCPFAPDNFPKNRKFIDFPLMHLEGLAPHNVLAKHNRYWAFDYGLNNNETLAYHRYLSNYLKLTLLLEPQTANHLLDPLDEEIPEEYTSELSGKQMQQHLSEHARNPRDHVFVGFQRFSFCVRD